MTWLRCQPRRIRVRSALWRGNREAPGIHTENFRFPRGFLCGAATAAQQVEGDLTNNDWYDWERAGKVSEPSGAACDHYRRFREDFDMGRELGHNAHRFSLEWSRIEPSRTLDFIGLNYYTRDFVQNTGWSLSGQLGNICALEHHQSVGKRNDLGWVAGGAGRGRGYPARRLPPLVPARQL